MKATHPALAILSDPKTQKVIKYAAIGIAGIVVVLVVKKQISKIASGSDIRKAEKALGDLDVRSYNLTLSEGEMNLIVQNIFSAMNRVGTDQEGIIRNLESLKSKDDLNLAIRMFGVKSYNGIMECTSQWKKNMGLCRDLNMNGWLNEELGGKHKDQAIAIYEKLGVNF